jgi:hypothetical protein
MPFRNFARDSSSSTLWEGGSGAGMHFARAAFPFFRARLRRMITPRLTVVTQPPTDQLQLPPPPQRNPSAACYLPYANRVSLLKSVLSRLAAVRERGDITRRPASPVRGDHDAIAGIPSGAEGERYQPFSVVPQAGMNGCPAAGDSPAAVRH